MTRSTLPALLAVILGLAAGTARAQDADERPWAKGVSPDDQRTALALFRDGNAALKEGLFPEAATKYRDALTRWDHPAIHYNLVLALRSLDQPLELRAHLMKAISYGAEPLDAAKFATAKLIQETVEKQLARIEVKCDEPGAQVVMDGRPLFTAPGKYEEFVRPGPHSIVATKQGYLTNQMSRALPAGELTALDLKLFKAEDLTKYKRRWSQAVPWGVVAAGAVVGLAGAGLHYGAAKSFDDFDQKVLASNGSAATNELTSLRSQGNTLQGVAIGCYAVGGAALVTGVVLVYLNRLIPYQDTTPGTAPDKKDAPAKTPGAPAPQEKPADKDPTWGLVPLLGPDGAGVSATFRF